MRRRGRTRKTKDVQKRHAKYRFIERVGIGLTDDLYNKILKGIQRGNYELVERQSNRVTLWKVPIEGKDFVVVYDSKRKSLATVLEG